MANTIFKLFVALSLLSSLDSLTVVNNVTLPSDFFQEQFFKELRSISNRSETIKSGGTNALKCVLELQEIATRLPKMEVLPFIDAWGILPSGLLRGHLTDYGNFDQCIDTTVILDKTFGTTTGQYCLASIPIQLSSKSFEEEVPLPLELTMKERISLGTQNIRFGICIPATCSSQLITRILKNALKNVLNGALSNVKVSQCSVGKKPDYEAIDIFAIVLFSFIGLMMVLSTLYDVFTSHLEKKPIQLLMAFSIITNGRKLFMINTKPSKNSIDCLTGIRLFSMIWVMYCHNYMAYGMLNLTNSIDILMVQKSLVNDGADGVRSVCVDSFIFLSGLLVAWLGLRELDKTNGKLNVLMMYVHRYIRLTPPVAAVILFYVSLLRYIGSGPNRDQFFDSLHDTCKEKWWTTLLYIQNYAYPEKACIAQSWYLALDTQLYVLSPLVLIPLWKWGKKCVPVLIGLSLLSIGCVIATYIIEGYTDLMGLQGVNQMQKTYLPTHTRYAVWIVGICTGYFMHINKQRTLRPPMVIQVVGWILCFGTLLSIIFAPYGTISSMHPASVGEAAAYEALKRVSWGIALAWIVIACHHGFGGIVNSILSHPIWQPFGRLTYCMYLVHFAVITIDLGTIRTDTYFSNYKLMLEFWSTFGISLLVAVVLSLSFEAPVLVIEKALLGTAKPKENVVGTGSTPASNGNSLPEHKEV